MCTTVCTKVHIQSLVFNTKMHHYVLLVLERHSHLPPFTYLVHVFFLNSVFVVIWGQSGLFWKTSVNVTSFCEGFYLRLKRIFALKMKASPAEGNSSVLTCVVGLEGQLVHPPVSRFLLVYPPHNPFIVGKFIPLTYLFLSLICIFRPCSFHAVL